MSECFRESISHFVELSALTILLKNYQFRAFTFVLILLVGMRPFISVSQSYSPPDNYQFNAVEDYDTYLDDVKEAMNWYLESDLSDGMDRQPVSAFIMKWLTGSPLVHLEIRQEIIGGLMNGPVYVYQGDFLMIYLCGMALHELRSASKPTLEEIQYQGVLSMINSYRKVKDAASSSYLNKMQKMEEKGKLKSWVEKQL